MSNLITILACTDSPLPEPAATVENEESENKTRLAESGLMPIDLHSVDFRGLGVDNRTINLIYELDVNDARHCHANGPRDEWLGFEEIYFSGEARSFLTLPPMGHHGFGHAYLFGEPEKGQYLDFDFQLGEVSVIGDENEDQSDDQVASSNHKTQLSAGLDNYLAGSTDLNESDVIIVSDILAGMASQDSEVVFNNDDVAKVECWKNSQTLRIYKAMGQVLKSAKLKSMKAT